MSNKFAYLTKPIIILGLVSLFTDMASEMLYPLMPAFLKSIGFSVLLIGIMEGFVEMVAGLSKGYFGQLSDVKQKRVPFVRLGYFLSAISKPMLAAFTYPFWIFFARSVDRTGKGLRTSPRDALLALQSSTENKGKVFGFHRALDTTGAVLGPLIALLYLKSHPGDYRNLFLIAFIPGMVAVVFTFAIREVKGKKSGKKINFFSFFGYFKTASKPYRKLITGLLIFALVNSSDVLLLLKMKEAHVDDLVIIYIYIFYNIVYALASFPAGILADKFGIKRIFILGLIFFVATYAGFSIAENKNIYILLFFTYGLYAACTDGIAKAWISNITPAAETGTAIGAWLSLSSIGAFVASSTAGFIWYEAGAGFAFGFTATVALLVACYLLTLQYKPLSTSETAP